MKTPKRSKQNLGIRRVSLGMPGTLAELVDRKAAEENVTRSRYISEILANHLGVPYGQQQFEIR